MKNRRIAALVAAGALALGAGAALAPSAHADGQLCYDVDVVVNGDALVDEAACEVLEAPALPQP